MAKKVLTIDGGGIEPFVCMACPKTEDDSDPLEFEAPEFDGENYPTCPTCKRNDYVNEGGA